MMLSNKIREKLREEISSLTQSLFDSSITQNEIGVYVGLGGFMLLSSYQFQNSNDEKFLISLNKCFYLSHDILNNSPKVNLSFANGLAGWGWVVSHLEAKEQLDNDITDLLDDVDEILKVDLDRNIKTGNFDSLYGALGLGKYFLKRKKRSEVIKIVEFLNDTKIELAGTLTWKRYNANTSKEEYNLSLAHGLTGIVYFLCKCILADISIVLCKNLLDGALQFFCANVRNNADLISILPGAIPVSNIFPDNHSAGYSRLGWCYGDLSTFYILWQAARIIRDSTLADFFLSHLVSSTLRKDFNSTLIVDPGFCHGTIGITYIYRKLWLKTGNQIFQTAADYWLNETLLFKKKQGAGDTYLYLLGNFENRRFQSSHNLLEGDIGLCMVYLSILNKNLTDDWDEVFMLD